MCLCLQVMRHGVGLSTSSDSELITQLLALTPPMEEADAPDWVARSVLGSRIVNAAIYDTRLFCYLYWSNCEQFFT